MKLKYLSLFSGAGGFDIGLESLGFQSLALCEIDKTFCETLNSNKGWTHTDNNIYFDSAKIINADIRDLKFSDITDEKEVDLIIGGPPCQAFSSSGKQLSILDPRGALLSEFIRIIDEGRPKMFVFENVRGIITARDKNGTVGGVIAELINTLEEIGYSCRATLLNSADYGSYQRRVRCLIIGTRHGVAPNFPKPSYLKQAGLFATSWNTLEDFLSLHSDTDEINYAYPSPQIKEILESLPNGTGIKSPGKAEATRPGGHWGYRQGTFIADLKLPARTVTGSSSQDWIRWNGKLRRLTFNEIKLLQGFPTDWNFEGTSAQKYKQVGNAVPTVFGKIIGKTILEFFKNYPTFEPVKLGIPQLFKGFIEYTQKDHDKNKESRKRHQYFES